MIRPTRSSNLRSSAAKLCLALTALAGFVILLPGRALACRCPEYVRAETPYERAHFVITGKVVEVRPNADGDGWTATVTVDHAWKADIPKTISISSHTTCAFKFEQGADYVLYLFRNKKDGSYYTSKCAGNLPIADAASRLKWLEQHGTAASITGP